MANAKHNSNDPRSSAHRALVAIWRKECLLSPKLFEGEASNIARAQRLTRETLRYEDALLRHIKRHVQKNPKLPIRALLCLAAYEFFIENEKDYGIVNAYVEIAKSNNDMKNAAGFVNAVLRKMFESEINLNQNNSFGADLHAHLRKQYDKKHILDMAQAQVTRTHLDLRIKDGAVSEWAKKLDALPLDNHSAVRLPASERVTEIEGYADGAWWVQDIAATIAVDCFDDLNGKAILDLCAAPGGKTLQMSAKGADVTAVEISEKRATRIHENLERVALKAQVLITDALEFNSGEFDAILLDAPCSATGTLTRHPDLKHNAPLERMLSLVDIQAQLLSHAFTLLKTGGELIYVTCSLLKEEGEAQIETFITKEPRAKLIPLDAARFNLSTAYAPYIRTFPTAAEGRMSMDGFFIAKLTKV